MTGYASTLEPKRRFTFAEAYQVAVDAVRSIPDFIRSRQELGAPFVERIMLAVTEVNGCPACAYEHTKMALRAGLDSDEIRQMLSGEYDGVPDRELPALMFAQHYADSGGNPDPEAWAAVVKEYGSALANGILGAIRVMMWGNVIGLAYSGLQAKFAGETLEGSSTPRDAAMMTFSVLNLPVVAVQAALSNMVRRPLLQTTENPAEQSSEQASTTLGAQPFQPLDLTGRPKK